MKLPSWQRTLALFKPGESIEEKNHWHFYSEIAWYGILFGIVQSFLGVYVIRVGGSDAHVGLVTALPAIIVALVSLPGSRLVERDTKPPRLIVLTAFLQRMGYLLIALVPTFFVTNRADAIVVLVGLLSSPLAIASVAFTSLFARAVNPKHRARVVSIRNVWLGISQTTAGLLGGRLLDLVIFPINFQILFGLGYLAGMVGMYSLTRLQVPPGSVIPSQRIKTSWREIFRFITNNRAFMRFAVTVFLFHWGLYFAAPLFTIYWVRNLGASDGWVGLFTTMTNASTIVFFFVWGNLVTRWGNRRVLILTACGLALIPVLTALATTNELILVVALLGGAISPGFAIVMFNGLLQVCPEENRATFIATFNMLVNVAVFASPIIATMLTATLSVPILLMLAGALRLLGGLIIWRGGALVPQKNIGATR